MFIERNGVKIELTQEEQLAAYKEVQKGYVQDDIMKSFVCCYLDGSESYEFDDFIDDMSSDKYASESEFYDVYEELCGNFGKIVVDELIENPNAFLEDVYNTYNNDLDSNEDYNSQIEWAVKSVLCDRAHEIKTLYSKACDDLYNLRSLVRNYEGTFDELCEQLNGFNKEAGQYFDVNYGALTMTILCSDDGLVLDERCVDIWNDAKNDVVHETLTVDEFKEICIKAGVDADNIQSSLNANSTTKGFDFSKAVERYNDIMKTLGRDKYTIGLSTSIGTENWNIRDMVAECNSVLAMYHTDAYVNKFPQGLWDSITDMLSGFVKEYEAYIKDVVCTIRHGSRFDNQKNDKVSSDSKSVDELIGEAVVKSGAYDKTKEFEPDKGLE